VILQGRVRLHICLPASDVCAGVWLTYQPLSLAPTIII
jgi:hypothetical protein